MVLYGYICDGNGNYLSGPLQAIISCDCTPESMDQFPAHTVVFDGSERRAVQNIQILDTIKIVDTNIGQFPNGVIAWGVVLDPEQQIDDQGDRIHVSLLDITEQTRWIDTGLGWVASNAIGVITSRLGSLVPGWSAIFTDTTGLQSSASPAVWISVTPAMQPTPEGNTVAKVGLTPPPTDPLYSLGAWDAAAVTQQGIAAGQSSISFRAVEVTTHRMCGFTTGLHTFGLTPYVDMQFGIFLQQSPNPSQANPSSFATVYESGVAGPSIAYEPGDVFTIGINAANGVTYYKDGVAFWSSAVLATYPMAGVAFGFTPGATIDSANMSIQTTPNAAWWAVQYNKETIQGALTQLANNAFKHIRTARDSFGNPIQRYEVGSYGAAKDVNGNSLDQSTIRLLSPDGIVSAMTAQNNIRVITALTRKRDGTKLTNAVTPLGASTGDVQVDLELAWRMINGRAVPPGVGTPPTPPQPAYIYYVPNYPAAFSPFPEYDANYPISRKPTLDGRFEYYITTQKTDIPNPTTNFMWSQFQDSSFTYVDSTDANRTVTARALYVAAKANLQWFGFVHDTLTIKAEGRGRPPRAGQSVYVRYVRYGRDVQGEFVEMQLTGNYIIMQVDRSYAQDGSAIDTYTLTNNGRWPDTNGSQAADNARQLQALRMTPQNNVAMFTLMPGRVKVAASGQNNNPDFGFTLPIVLPLSVFRVQTATLNCDFLPFRSSSMVAEVLDQFANPTGGFSAATNVVINFFTNSDATTAANGTFTSTMRGQAGGTQLGFTANPTDTTGSLGQITANLNGGTHTSMMQGQAAGSIAGYSLGVSPSLGTYGQINSNSARPGTFSVGNVANGLGTSNVGGMVHHTSLNSTIPNSAQTYSAGTQTPNPGVTIQSKNPNTDAWFNNHAHYWFVFGGNTDPTSGTQNIWLKDGRNPAMTASGQFKVITGGPTDGNGNSTAVPNLAHDHSGTTGNVDVGHSTDAQHAHDYQHQHDMNHQHDTAHLHYVDHYHDFNHSHNFIHTHFVDHSHSFPHIHRLAQGIFEGPKPFQINVSVDNGNGTVLDISPYLYDNNTQKYGPFQASFAITDIAQFINYPGKTVKLRFDSISSGPNGTVNPTGLGELFIYLTLVVEINGVSSIVYAT